MRCSILAIAVLATVAWGAAVLQVVPRHQSGTAKFDLLHSATTCTPRNALTSANGLPSGLVSSRSVAPVRWITAEDPEIALRIMGQTAASEGLSLFLTGVVTWMRRQRANVQAEHLPQGFITSDVGTTTSSRFLYSICPQPPGNPVLTWEMAHRVLSSLSLYMLTGGGYRLVQYHAFTAGATPAEDVQFASGVIGLATVAEVSHLLLPVL